MLKTNNLTKHIIAVQENKYKKGGDAEACRARKRTKAYCRMSRTMTQPCAFLRAKLLQLFFFTVHNLRIESKYEGVRGDSPEGQRAKPAKP